MYCPVSCGHLTMLILPMNRGIFLKFILYGCVECVVYAVYMCVVHEFECVHVQKSEDKTGCPPLSPCATLPGEKISQRAGSSPVCLGWLAPVNSQDPPVPTLANTGVAGTHRHA